MRQKNTTTIGNLSGFQSTHPRGVRLSTMTAGDIAGNFNPRTHVGCDSKNLSVIHAVIHISIHAPTWGATKNRARGGGDNPISIHAPTWGATSLRKLMKLFFFISIHAPTWGATATVSVRGVSDTFQSTHPRGVRPCLSDDCVQ